jgi:hypothetical protein
VALHPVAMPVALSVFLCFAECYNDVMHLSIALPSQRVESKSNAASGTGSKVGAAEKSAGFAIVKLHGMWSTSNSADVRSLRTNKGSFHSGCKSGH